MSFAFLLSGLSALGLMAFLLIAPPARMLDVCLMLGGAGAVFIFMAIATKGPGRHRR